MSLHAFDPLRLLDGGEGFRPRLLDLVVSTPPAELPVEIDGVKEWLRVDGADQDVVIADLIAASVEWAEGYTRRSFVERGLTVRFAELPATGLDLRLPLPNVIDVSAATYVDTSGEAQVIDVADFTVEPTFGMLTENFGFSWPTDVASVEFVYTAGYGDADAVPAQIKRAIRTDIEQGFRFRSDQELGSQFTKTHAKASMALLDHFRVFLT